MVRLDPAGTGTAAAPPAGPFLYLEGPADRAILQAWVARLLPGGARRLFSTSVILGGRQPARARDHFLSRGGRRGLCILDRDDGRDGHDEDGGDSGLEFFTWGRRHIESYLLVAPAIGRALRLPSDDGRIERALRAIVPATPEDRSWRDLDAKRVLAPAGPLARAAGAPLRPAAIARAMRPSEIHADVRECVRRLCAVFGVRTPPL